MGKYQVGEETRRKILEASREIFYQKGYDGTLYNDIAKSAKVNRALIPYHYKNKSDLAMAVYNGFMQEYVSTREEIAAGYSKVEKLVISVLYFYRLLENEKVARFVNYIIGEKSFWERLVWGESVMYEKVIPENKCYTEKEWNMLIHMILGMESETVNMIYLKMYDDIREMGKIMLEMVLGKFGYSQEQAEQLFNKVHRILDQYDYEVTPRFEVLVGFRS